MFHLTNRLMIIRSGKTIRREQKNYRIFSAIGTMAGAQAVCKFCQSNLRKNDLCIECGKNQPRRLLSPKSGSDFCPQCQEDHMSAGGAMVLKHADTYHPRDKRSDYIKPEDRAPEAREDLYITRHNKGSGKD